MDRTRAGNSDPGPDLTRRDLGRQAGGFLLAASLGWLANQEREDWRSRSLEDRTTGALEPSEVPPPPAPPVTPAFDPARVSGTVEAIPDRTFRLTPYNNWPVLEIHVHEGERLSFYRKDGAYHGGKHLLTQRETPAEIDLFKEQVQIAEIQKKEEVGRKELIEVEFGRQIEQAKTRLDNAQKEAERLQALYARSAATEQDVRRATNIAALAKSQLDELDFTRTVKRKLVDLAIERAEHEILKAHSEHDLADFKREYSWGRVPVTGGHFENVVVTRVHATRGMIPNENGLRDVWIEVVDDREVYVRAMVPDEQTDALRPGASVKVRQGSRSYDGRILTICQEADRATALVPVLVVVANPTFRLRLNSRVQVDLSVRSPS